MTIRFVSTLNIIIIGLCYALDLTERYISYDHGECMLALMIKPNLLALRRILFQIF